MRMRLVAAGIALVWLGTTAVAVADPGIPQHVVTGISGPESAVWDPETSAWYVSVGGFTGSGGVVRLEPGSDTPEEFVTGLGGPQGVTIHDGTMYVADGDHLQAISMADPSQQSSIPTGGGASDVDVDPETGDLYVTDLGGGVVWRIHDGVVEEEPFAEINTPDGIYVQDGGVFIANFALGGAGGIFRFDIATGERTTVSDIPGATLDGLEPDGGDWLTTDFTKGHLWRVGPDGVPTPVAQLLPGSADLGIDREARIVAVPNLLLNNIVFLQL